MYSQYSIAWSPDLHRSLKDLTAQRRRAILTIVTDEANGVSLLRRLKTPYSCRWCGWYAPDYLGPRDERKAALEKHEKNCDRKGGEPWQFIANLSTYYNTWTKDEDFNSCLARARAEFADQVLRDAGLILKLAAPDSARELARQVKYAGKDVDRRSAAVAILDRISLGDTPSELEPITVDIKFRKALERAYGDPDPDETE